MNDMTPLALVQACIGSCNRVVDWIQEGDADEAVETLQYVLDDLEDLQRRLESAGSEKAA